MTLIIQFILALYCSIKIRVKRTNGLISYLNKAVLFLFVAIIGNNTTYAKSVNYTIEYIYDQQEELSENNISAAQFSTFPDNEHFGFDQGTYWFKLKINNKSSSINKYVLQVPTFNIGTVYLFQNSNNIIKQVAESYGTTYKGEQVVESLFPSFNVEVLANNQTTVYLRTNFQKETNFPFVIYEESDFYFHVADNKMIAGVYYGLLVAVIIFNLFFYYKFRDNIYPYYTLFLIAYSVAMLFYDGVFRLFPTLDLEYLNRFFMLITMYLFSYEFLDIQRHLPSYKKVVFTTIVMMAIFDITYFLTGNNLFLATGDAIAMTGFLATWGVAFYLLKKVEYAWFYVVGYFILITCGFYVTLSYNLGVDTISADSIFFKVASIIDMFIFTYAITHRMEIQNNENSRIIGELQSFLADVKESKEMQTPIIDPFYVLLKENELSSQALTLREVEILKSIHKGFTNTDIAEQLFISSNTVKYHVKNVYKKLNVKNRKETSEKIVKILSIDNQSVNSKGRKNYP